jgi:hypothetical protein
LKKLSQEAFSRARDFIFTQGRELDQKLFSFTFENGQGSAVVDALKPFQNPDGGFGNALEPDIRTTASSAIATQHAFEYLRAVGAVDGDLVRHGIEYLVRTFDHHRGVWAIIPPEVEDASHAPWWGYEDSEDNFGGFRANPTAALAGLLHLFPALVPSVLLTRAANQAVDYLNSIPDEDMEMHDYLCYLTLVEAVTGSKRESILKKLIRAAPHTIEFDQEKWSEYNPRPLAIAPKPGSVLSPIMKSSILEANLDYEIDEQLSDGSWPLSWSWDFIDAAAWSEAEKEWKGHHAVRKLVVFRDYGRLE